MNDNQKLDNNLLCQEIENGMKAKYIFRGLMVVTALNACMSIVSCSTSEHQSWVFIQKVGGIEVGELQQTSSTGAFLPVRVDVSGLSTITRKPEAMNSALKVQRVGHKIESDKIVLWVETCLVSKEHDSPISQGISLPGIAPGRYQVQYADPDGRTHDIRYVQVPRKN